MEHVLLSISSIFMKSGEWLDYGPEESWLNLETLGLPLPEVGWTTAVHPVVTSLNEVMNTVQQRHQNLVTLKTHSTSAKKACIKVQNLSVQITIYVQQHVWEKFMSPIKSRWKWRTTGWITVPQRLKLCNAAHCHQQMLLSELTKLTKMHCSKWWTRKQHTWNSVNNNSVFKRHKLPGLNARWLKCTIWDGGPGLDILDPSVQYSPIIWLITIQRIFLILILVPMQNVSFQYFCKFCWLNSTASFEFFALALTGYYYIST